MKVGRRVLKIGNMRIPLYHSLFSQEALRKCIWCTVLSVLSTHHTFSLPVFSYIELSITGVASEVAGLLRTYVRYLKAPLCTYMYIQYVSMAQSTYLFQLFVWFGTSLLAPCMTIKSIESIDVSIHSD